MAESRKVPGQNWIKGYHYWLQESEAPNSYIDWSGLSALAGATQRKVYVKWGYHTYYANLYIILVGPAGIVHKSSTIDHVRRIYKEIGIPTVSESLSREELIKQMISRGDGTVSAVTALPDELSDFIRVSGPTMIEFLTTIYGSPNSWEYSTRARSTEEIKNAFLNVLGGTTPRWIAEEFDATFVEGGFASRTLFVLETQPRFRKARMVITPEMYKMHDCLVQDLHHISSLEGEFAWDEDAWDWFDNWYTHELENELKGIDYRLHSYIARKPTHLLKLCMILQLNETDDKRITLDNMLAGKALLDNLEMSMAKTFSAVGKNIYASDLERIAAEVKAAGDEGMEMSELMKRNYSQMSKQILDETLNTLVQMGMLQRTLKGMTLVYVATY